VKLFQNGNRHQHKVESWVAAGFSSQSETARGLRTLAATRSAGHRLPRRQNHPTRRREEREKGAWHVSGHGRSPGAGRSWMPPLCHKVIGKRS